MTTPMKFGRQSAVRPPFEINDLRFASTPLSLNEEQKLAEAGGESEDHTAVITALVAVLAELLNARKEGNQKDIDTDWLMDNLAPNDLEGIVEHLRGN